MTASGTLFHDVRAQIEQLTPAPRPGGASVRRLALLTTGILAAKTTVLAKMAAELHNLGVTWATMPESVERGLRRALADERLDAQGYAQAVMAAVDWEALRRAGEPVLLIVDESSQADHIHLLRLSLAYWGGNVVVAWAVWEQNVPLPDGQYWEQMDAVFAAAARIVPADLPVLVAADRAFDVPAFVDRVAARGWHWLVRAKAKGALRYRPLVGSEGSLRQQVERCVQRPGQRWKGRGWVFKKAGWRAASVVAYWAPGEAEPVVVLSDLPPRWELVARYGRRFWIESGFRADKTGGWQWEASGVQGVAHHARLVLAMAWATLVTVGLGVTEATRRLTRLRGRPLRPRRPGWWGRVVQHARHSVFTLGLRRLGAWLYGTLRPPLPGTLSDPAALSWNDRWRQAQIAHNLAGITVRP